ncbi:3-keto-5-aminohexanoate cleavage protein [Azoarcus sp. L1K30]|uniref:3-keto-5-aminohexanoate cleavage protein n=1 Tax=Azoarcus sp. L1K30 TaxID=2820277 RepID=UPI001B82E8B1|nr:3-keto-5-aminohexanoate cleavage protein [Azoarcus sp. L1K30]MBR0567226.1 3-keto-5-aminohexanoate cleavage protein [Azoarcus sp. L1K30]
MSASEGHPFSINLACTGAIPTRLNSPYVPLTHAEIIDEVGACLEMGVQMFHLHARDAAGRQSSDPERYGRLIESIRALPGGRSAILCVTTSGRFEAGFEARAGVLGLEGDMKPDMASLTLSSLNFAQSESVNAPDTIRRLAARMRERGIRPELEVFDLGMANFGKVLIREGLIDAPVYINVLLGNIAGAQCDAVSAGCLMSALPEGAHVAMAGLGRQQLSANLYGLLFADGVRVGLEDNVWFDAARAVPATNREMVMRIKRMAAELERPLWGVDALRRRLGLCAVAA